MKSCKWLVLVAVMLAGVVPAFAQSAPNLANGFTPYGSFDEHQIGAVNLMNGNLVTHVSHPQHYPQRGGRLNNDFVLALNAKTWTVQSYTSPDNCCPPVYYWTSNPGWGPLSMSSGATVLPSATRTYEIDVDPAGNTTYSDYGYHVSTWDGGVDPADWNIAPGNPDANGTPQGGTIFDPDGNQYTIASWAGPCHTTTNDGLNGNTMTTLCNQLAHATVARDTNGNIFGLPNSSPFTDTLGRTFGAFPSSGSINSTSDYSGCVSPLPIASANLNTYPGPNGVTNQIKVCYSTLQLQTNFGISGTLEFPNRYSGSANVSAPMTMILPDGTKWVFQYDSYGNLTSIGLPLGGSVSYQWETVAFPPVPDSNITVSRAVSSRTVNDNNGNSSTWTYHWMTQQTTGSSGAVTSYTNVVTDPLGNDAVHVFTNLGSAYYETSTLYYQGSSGSGQLLKRVDTAYQVDCVSGIAAPNVCSAATPPTYDLPISIQTTVYPSGEVSKVTKSYDTAGLGKVVAEKDYDWGQGTPGALLRETDTTYEWQANSAYLNANLLDLPASVVVKDGNGNRVAETDYTYDESAYLTASNITTQHGAAPNTVRGNLTTVSKWLNTSTSPVVSHTNWYDTGEVYQQIDPLGNTTTHSYDPAYVGGYSTRTCNALSQCVSGTYDFTTGLLTSFTDANGSYAASGNTPGDPAHTSNYSYDFLSRLTSAQLPPDPAGNNPQTTFSYSAAGTFPMTVQRQKTITTSLTDTLTTYLDGLGRPYQTQHATPNGNATVQTTYDGLDHAVSVTNPYFSTSDPTYGVIQTQYDALGRVTQVTKQDGSVSSMAYDTVPIQAVAGDCTRTTDEAGKQRLTCADGLGRLTEVHEPGDNFSGTQAQGSFSVGGNLQTYTIPGTNATTATGSVTISGRQQSIITSTRVCDQYGLNGRCVAWETDSTTTYDSGAVTITVNGQPYTYNYGANQQTDNVSSISSALQSTINNTSSYVQVSSVSVNLSANPPTATLYLQARSAGASGNFSLAASTSYNTQYFTQASFTAGASGASLTGGANGTNPSTVYDSGTVTVTIGSFTASAPYSQGGNSTAGQVAQALISSSNPNNLNRSGSPVTASVSGSTITINYSSVGTAGNVSVSCGSSTSQGTYFSSPSFSCPVTTALNGGYNPEAPSLDFNYFVTQYGYDALGNLLNVTQKGDPTVTSSSQWRVRSFTYDSLSRLLTATNPESGQISYSYDADGNMLQKTSPAPNQTGSATQTISYCYDKLNRVTGKAHSAQTCANGQLPSGTAVVTYAYDAGANGIGHLTSLTDQAGSGSYSFDALGRIGSESRTIAGIQKNLAYTYNLDNSVATLTYPSGAVVTYTPDSAGRIASAVDSGNNINYITGATYGPDSALTGFVSGNSSSFAGITNTFSYNTRLQPCRLSATTGAPPASCTDGTNIGNVIDLSYDFHLGSGNNGNVFRLVNNKDLSRIQTFTYDALNRLTSAQNAGTDCTKFTVNGKTEYWANSYSYDAWGNLLQKTVTKCSAENLSVTALANNQLSGYSYDSAGNMTHDATTNLSYSFDQENRITGAAGYTYTYDADGNRVEKSNGSTGTIYWYMSPGIVGESDLTGALKSEYVFFAGERVARKDLPGNTVSYYFSDHLKTASVITDSAGNIKEDEDYYPWGGELQFANNDSNHYKFTGKERDVETGLDYFGARYYGNWLGRWMSPDWAEKPEAVPYSDLHDPQSLNLYSYVRNIPTSKADVDGHCLEDACVVEGIVFGAYLVSSYLASPPGQNALRGLGNAIGGAISSMGGLFHRSSNTPPPPSSGTGTQGQSQSQPAVHEVDPAKHPETAGHVKDAQAAGKPKVVTVAKAGAAGRRAAATKGVPTAKNKDRDEYPPASTAEGGNGASVRSVDSSDNRGAGADWGNTIKNLPDGTKVEIRVKEQK